MTPAPKRRWFRWSLRALLVAATILPIIGWQCVTWPISETVDPALHVQVVDGREVQNYLGPYTYSRPPGIREVTTRMLAATAVLAAMSIVALLLARRRK